MKCRTKIWHFAPLILQYYNLIVRYKDEMNLVWFNLSVFRVDPSLAGSTFYCLLYIIITSVYPVGGWREGGVTQNWISCSASQYLSTSLIFFNIFLKSQKPIKKFCLSGSRHTHVHLAKLTGHSLTMVWL